MLGSRRKAEKESRGSSSLALGCFRIYSGGLGRILKRDVTKTCMF